MASTSGRYAADASPSASSTGVSMASRATSQIRDSMTGEVVAGPAGAFQRMFLARKEKMAEERRTEEEKKQRKLQEEAEFQQKRLREEDDRARELQRAKLELERSELANGLNLQQADFLVAHQSELTRKENIRKQQAVEVAPNPYDTSLYGTVDNATFSVRGNVRSQRAMLDLVFGFSSEIDPLDLDAAETDLTDPEGRVHVINPERTARRIMLKYAQLLDNTLAATQKEVLRTGLKRIVEQYMLAYKDAKVSKFDAAEPMGPRAVADANRTTFLRELFPSASWDKVVGPAADFSHMSQQDAAAAALAASRVQTFHRGSDAGAMHDQHLHEEAFGHQEELGVGTFTLDQPQTAATREGERPERTTGARHLRGLVRFVSSQPDDPEVAVRRGYGLTSDDGDDKAVSAEVGAGFRRVPRAWKPGGQETGGSLSAAVSALKRLGQAPS